MRNITLDGGGAAKHGLNVYHAGVRVLENVEISELPLVCMVVNNTELSVDARIMRR